jgi:hypothetical protein
VILTTTPEYHREIGMPRVAAIEYPFGRPIGQVNDRDGQRSVLIQTLSVLESVDKPGQVSHLPFTWPEDPKKTNWHPPEISPLVKSLLDEIKKAGRNSRA